MPKKLGALHGSKFDLLTFQVYHQHKTRIENELNSKAPYRMTQIELKYLDIGTTR